MDNIFTELRDIIGKEYDFRVEVSLIEFNVILSREMFEDFDNPNRPLFSKQTAQKIMKNLGEEIPEKIEES